jgi:hypothetical protein
VIPTAAPQPPSHERTAPAHLLALARVRSLSARPPGPFRVRRTPEDRAHHQ